ncbi:peptidyl-prolyl cis-trans isomerase FKBP2 isoform X1 [Phyllostomus hastatus]|uniref:peptidyl-prolyl cis-trans isomerase FKBP2 isoform X1 n=1 Tax=Phyllostomus hastatus TaxID=9423 RepID=UPI001E67E444|nr:peptidyl-prolyl cis-trans isomerase FKBP2 isoform X1 [Phyllostomus hastatus]
MPQGEGSHAARGGAPALGAGPGSETGGTCERVPVEGGTLGLGAELGLVRGGVWTLKEELEQVEGGASGLETEGDPDQALGAGPQPVFHALPALPVDWSVGVCSRRDMRVSWVLTVLSICLSALATAAGAEGKRKLQIGVKKRVDHCPIKSRKGDVLHMHYTGKLEDGTEFDSSLPQNQPFVFSLGTGQVIKGWDQGLLGMCEGEKRKLVIPSELGYGERGAPPKIPGGATLVFEVELLKIERRSEL